MNSVIENYREVIIHVIGMISVFVMLAFSFTVYTTVVDSMLNAVFYK